MGGLFPIKQVHDHLAVHIASINADRVAVGEESDKLNSGIELLRGKLHAPHC